MTRLKIFKVVLTRGPLYILGYNTKKMIIISAYRPYDEHFEKDGKTRNGR